MVMMARTQPITPGRQMTPALRESPLDIKVSAHQRVPFTRAATERAAGMKMTLRERLRPKRRRLNCGHAMNMPMPYALRLEHR